MNISMWGQSDDLLRLKPEQRDSIELYCSLLTGDSDAQLTFGNGLVSVTVEFFQGSWAFSVVGHQSGPSADLTLYPAGEGPDAPNHSQQLVLSTEEDVETVTYDGPDSLRSPVTFDPTTETGRVSAVSRQKEAPDRTMDTT